MENKRSLQKRKDRRKSISFILCFVLVFVAIGGNLTSFAGDPDEMGSQTSTSPAAITNDMSDNDNNASEIKNGDDDNLAEKNLDTSVKRETRNLTQSDEKTRGTGSSEFEKKVSVKITDLNNKSFESSDVVDYTWDYVKDYSYITAITIEGDASYVGKNIKLTIPEFLKLEKPETANKEGLESLTTKGNTATIVINKDLIGKTLDLSFKSVSSRSASNPYPNDAKNAMFVEIGKDIKTEFINNGNRPTYSTTIELDDSDTSDKVEVSVVPQKYATEGIIDSFALHSTGNPQGNSKKENGIINQSGQIGQRGEGGKFYSGWYYYLSNKIQHDPFWNMDMKIVIPKEMSIGEDGPQDKVKIDPNTNEQYILLEDINVKDLKENVAALNRMLSPTIDEVKGAVYGIGADYCGRYEQGGSIFGLDLDLQLNETPVPGKKYALKASVTYDNCDGSQKQDFEFPFETMNFKSVDRYNIGYATGYSWHTKFDLPQAKTNVNTLDYQQYIYLSDNNNDQDFNNPHKGGTFTIKMKNDEKGFEIYKAKAEQATSAEYIMQGSSEIKTAEIKDGEFIFNDAVGSGAVSQIIFHLDNGLKLRTDDAPVGMGVSFTMRTNDMNVDDYETSITAILRDAPDSTPGKDGCTEFNNIEDNKNDPDIRNGEHSAVLDMVFRKELDNLIVQTYGGSHNEGAGSPWPTMIIPALTRNIFKDEFYGAHVAFGISGGETSTNKIGSWKTYKDFEVDLKGNRAIETFDGKIKLNKYMYYKNAKFVYTTNLEETPQETSLISSGNPNSVTSGADKIVDIELKDNEYFTSIKFVAEEFKPLKVIYNDAGTGQVQVGKYWSYMGVGARISFVSKQNREFLSDGSKIEDYPLTKTSYEFYANYKSVDKKETVADIFEPTPVRFTRYRYVGIDMNTAGPQIKEPSKVTQGEKFKAKLSIDHWTGITWNAYARTIWLKVNPDFIYVGEDSNISQIEINEEKYLVIGGETPLEKNASTYTIDMQALPSASGGDQNVFLDGWADYTKSTIPELAGEVEPYTVVNPRNQIKDPYDINKNGEKDEVLAPIRNMNTTVLIANSDGTSVVPGVEGQFDFENKHTIFTDKQTELLNGYVSFGGSSVSVDDYYVEFNLPSKGGISTYSEGQNQINKESEFTLRLTEEPIIDLEDEDQILYKVNGEWKNASQINDWSKITTIKIYKKLLPSNVTIGMQMKLKLMEDIYTLNDKDEAYIVADCSKTIATKTTKFKSNLATYELTFTDRVVSYFSGYGDNEEYTNIRKDDVKYNTTIEKPSYTPTRENFTFDNWYKSTKGALALDVNDLWDFDTDRVISNTKLYAGWNPVEYDVKYHLNYDDAGIHESQKVKHNQSAIKPTDDPTRKGYTFDGWYNDKAGENAYDFDTKITEDKNLYAKWIPNVYTVTYDVNAEDVATIEAMTVTVPDKNIDALPTPPERDGYIFNGWNTEQNGTGEKFTAEYIIEEDITVYAQWEAKYYQLSFNLNGAPGVPPETQAVQFGATASAVENPIWDGYIFKGWNTEKNGSGTQWNFAENTMPNHDVVLYAQWEADPGVLGQTDNPDGDGDGSVLGEESNPDGGNVLGEEAKTSDAINMMGLLLIIALAALTISIVVLKRRNKESA